MQNAGSISVGIGGLGTIGLAVARALLAGRIPGMHLEAVAVRDPANVAQRLPGAAVDAVDFATLAARCGVILEVLPSAHFRAIAEPAISAGKTFVTLSVGALLEAGDLIERARTCGARIIVPTGALLGLDAVRAAAEGEIYSVTMETRKPPAGLLGAPYLLEHGIVLDGLREPQLVFSGSARDGARGFPANVNVAAALSLAGIGPDRTRLDIWADPTVTRNTHRIIVEADSVRLTMMIENVPSEENPKTGKLTALSTITTLRGLVSSLRIGS
ncbi:MAG TPA: aspartate dehydrogenase [Candidatus Lustribacter sp.]